MTATQDLVARDPIDQLKDRLDDPAVASSLLTVLEHADLLAVLVQGLDGLVRNSPVIIDSVSQTLGEARTAGESTRATSADLGKVVGSLGDLASISDEIAPLLRRVVDSGVTGSTQLDALAMAADALVDGVRIAERTDVRVHTIRGLYALLKDDDFTRGLGTFVEVARALGRRVGSAAPNTP